MIKFQIKKSFINSEDNLSSYQHKPARKSAFSLLEVSMVILVIALLVIAIVAGSRIIKKSKITSAKSMTASSPMPLIDGLVFWVESVSDTSFKPSEAVEGGVLSTWYDRGTSNITLDVGTTKPIYSYDVGINGIPAVQFNGNSSQYFSFDCSFLNNSYYTIILNEQRSSNATQYFLQGDNNFFLGYYNDTSIIHSQSSLSAGVSASPSVNNNSYSASISAYSKPAQRQIIFVSSSAGKKIYINGLEAASSADTSKISGLTTCSIGKGYNGMIGEIAIYNRALPI